MSCCTPCWPAMRRENDPGSVDERRGGSALWERCEHGVPSLARLERRPIMVHKGYEDSISTIVSIPHRRRHTHPEAILHNAPEQPRTPYRWPRGRETLLGTIWSGGHSPASLGVHRGPPKVLPFDAPDWDFRQEAATGPHLRRQRAKKIECGHGRAHAPRVLDHREHLVALVPRPF